MTDDPFQSIRGQPGDADAQAQWEVLEELRADDMRAEQGAAEAARASANLIGHATHAGFDGLFRALEPDPASRGGVYTERDALALLNSRYFVGKSKQETAVFRLNADGTATFVAPDQFKLEVQNIFVEAAIKTSSGNATKKVSAEKFWKEHPDRRELEIVFKPGGATKPNEYNLWRGFPVQPRKGWQRQRRLLRHIREVICCRNKEKFKYLIRYLAWSVQNPEKHSGVIIVLKSRKQGTGKSTLGKVMLDIFGQHGMMIDDKERLLGRFTDHLETTCFVVAEEILFAGDHRTTDKLKSLVTGDTLQVERKFGNCRQVPNRIKMMALTNHEHAIASGVRDRRNVVFEPSDERVGQKGWFDKLYQDLAAGGTSEFLHFLLSIRLGDWHPREILRTDESVEQQRMSADSVSQWAQACIHADAVIGAPRGAHGNPVTHSLGSTVSSEALREAYTGFCRQNGPRSVSTDAFGKACAEMFGPRQRLPAQPNGTRPWGYHVPIGTIWQGKVDARLGI